MTNAITWTTERRKIRDLIPWPRNPRQIKGEQVRRLQESVEEFGQFETVAVGPGNQVYNGHQRLKSWGAKFGPDYEVEVRVSSRELTEKEREKLTILAHKGAAGEWDFDTLANEFEVSELLEWGFSEKELQLGGFDLDEPKGDDPGAQVDKAEELRVKWGVEPGQLWQLGEHRLICGDCTDRAVVDRVMGGEKADMVVTDPPYGINLDSATSKLSREKDGWHNKPKEYAPIVGDDKPFDRATVSLEAKEEFWFGADYYTDTLPDFGRGGSWLVWDKRLEENLDVMLGSCFELCWSKQKHKREIIRVRWIGLHGTESQDVRSRIHPTQKPLQVIEWIFSHYSKEGDIITDPFLGGGTTLIACERLSRKCRAVEISPAYVAVALQRWADMTGKTPVLLESNAAPD